jgi:RHS repeat-associated protein
MRPASDCGWVDYLQNVGGQPPPPDALGQAVDSSHLKFSTGGDASWFAQTAVYYYDNDAAQSGPIGDNQESWLQTTVEGTGTVRFWWKVSCDSDDGFAFYVDDQYIFGRQGSADWQEYPHTITTTGPHTLKWRYSKGSSGSSGSDCAWVDYVRWSGSVPDPNGWQTITYTYDPAGRRIAKAVDGTTAVKYLYDGDQCIAEYDGSDNLLRKYIFGPGIDEPISMIDVEDSNATYYYHFDGLGSVVALTNSSGSTVELYEYSVYGQVAASDANIPNRFMFTGREFDQETGLYYYRARYYNPEVGRFLQTDPVGYGDGIGWYTYCGNSPIGRTDPSGEWSHYTHDWKDGELRIHCFDSGGQHAKTMTFSGWDEVVRMVNAGYDFCDVDFDKAAFMAFADATREREYASSQPLNVAKRAINSAVDAAADKLAGLPPDETLYEWGETSLKVSLIASSGGIGGALGGLACSTGLTAEGLLTGVASASTTVGAASTVLRGMNNPVVAEAVAAGNKMHDAFFAIMRAAGWNTNCTLTGSASRIKPDAWRVVGDVVEIIEYKPATATGIRAGARQIQAAISAARAAFPGKQINGWVEYYEK